MGRQPGYDRTAVLEAATGLFQGRGFHRVSVRDLVRTTGLNRFAIYEKFGGKEGLFYETLDYYHLVLVREQLLGPMRREDASLDTLLEMLRIIRGFNSDEARRSGCLIVNANIELGGADERVAMAVESVMDSFREAAGLALRCAERAGALRTRRSAEACAEHVVIQIQAFFALAYISRWAADKLMAALIDEVESWRASPARQAA